MGGGGGSQLNDLGSYLQDKELILVGNVGDNTGCMMEGGQITVEGDAGRGTGYGRRVENAITVKGKVDSWGKTYRELEEEREEDRWSVTQQTQQGVDQQQLRKIGDVWAGVNDEKKSPLELWEDICRSTSGIHANNATIQAVVGLFLGFISPPNWQGHVKEKAGFIISNLINNSPEQKITLIFRERGEKFNYLGSYLQDKELILVGNVGDNTGWGMKGGQITVKGNAGSYTGRTMCGGIIVVEGNSGSYTGEGRRVENAITVKGKVDSWGKNDEQLAQEKYYYSLSEERRRAEEEEEIRRRPPWNDFGCD